MCAKGRHLLAALLLLCAASVTADDLLNRFSSRVHTSEDGGTLPYRWYVPTNASAEKKVPLVILLHGSSGRGIDNETQFTAANRTAITFLLAQGGHPCAIAVPQCPPGDQWHRTLAQPQPSDQKPEPGPTMRRLIDLIRTQSRDPMVDAKRIYVIGNSLGGYGTWDLLSRAPDLIAAGVPICGGGPLDLAPKLVRTPLWAFHGAQDHVIKVDQSRRLIAAMREHGSEPRYTEFADAGHDIATQVFSTPDLAEWLFSQRRP